MAEARRRFQRPLGERRYKKLFVVAVEGKETEPEYFALFNSTQSVIHVECLKGGKKSSPLQVLARLENRLKDGRLQSSDEAWLVVDKDQWTDEQLSLLHAWTQQRINRGMALSNPKFEYWLLLHFEDGYGVASAKDCTDRLVRTPYGYGKHLDARQFTPVRIQEAIQRAKVRDQPPCEDWPRSVGTTVYRLVEALLV
jgi:hypothetical protein